MYPERKPEITNKVTVQFPILGILGLIFITLKLTGYIAWSWWWVLAPFWIPFVVVFGVIAFLFVWISVTKR